MSRALAAVLLIASVPGLGCAAAAPTQGAKVAEDVKKVSEDQRPERLLERGLAYAGVNDFTRAEQYLSAALEMGAPPQKVLPSLLKVCIAENRFRAALSYAEPQLTSHPNDFRLRFVVASLHASVGESAAALEHLEKVAKTRPDYAEAHYAMAVLLRDDLGDVARADAHFREYLRLEPNGPHAEEARGSLLKVVSPTAPVPRRVDTAAGAEEDGAPLPEAVGGPMKLVPGPSPAGEGTGTPGQPTPVSPRGMNPVQAGSARDTLPSPSH